MRARLGLDSGTDDLRRNGPMTNCSSSVVSQERFAEIKDEVRAVLIQRARLRGMISYSDLADQVNLRPRDTLLFQVLDKISAEEHAERRGMLSCIVVHKVGDMEPGVGFFELAARLGKKPRDKITFWIKELHRVHAVWEKAEKASLAAA